MTVRFWMQRFCAGFVSVDEGVRETGQKVRCAVGVKRADHI